MFFHLFTLLWFQEDPLPDLDKAYVDALRSAASGRKGSEIQLMRLMQRTGCCWGELRQETAEELLGYYVEHLKAREGEKRKEDKCREMFAEV